MLNLWYMKYLSRIKTGLILSALVLSVLSCSKNISNSNQAEANERLREMTTAPITSNDSNGQQASQPGINSPILPDSKLTPGDTLDVKKEDICVSGYSKKVRDVPQAVKAEAYGEYGITKREPKEYEIDHLISLELGGSNSIKNLWPESYRTTPWNAHVKDKLENRLHEMICNGQIDLKTAQQAIAANWINAYQKYVSDQPDAVKESRPAKTTSSSKDANSYRQPAANTSSTSTTASTTTGTIIGNKNSHIYHLPGCPDYDKVSAKNRVEFPSVKEAAAAGYRVAGNCRQK